MTEKRAHAELATKYFADSELKCWQWNTDVARWELIQYPYWHMHRIYHVGYRPPTSPPKRKVTLAGITFHAPETKALEPGTRYWFPDTVALAFKTSTNSWKDDDFDKHLLARGFVHLNQEDAFLHAEALIKVNKELK